MGLAADVRYDLAGAPVVPGLHDAHQHLSARGEELRRCDLSKAAVADLDELAAALTRYAADLPADAWVLGVGFDDAKLGGLPTRSGASPSSAWSPCRRLASSASSVTPTSPVWDRIGARCSIGSAPTSTRASRCPGARTVRWSPGRRCSGSRRW